MSARVVDLASISLLDSLSLVAELMAARLVVFPTDTVYGVGGSLRPEVGEALVAAKGRDPDKPLQVIFPNREVLFRAIEFSATLADVMYRLLPGPFTLVVPYPPRFTFPQPGSVATSSKRLFGRRGAARTVSTLGIRVPRWPEPARILSTLSFPLVASSANPSGGEAPATLGAVDPALLATCDLALDGGPAGGVASTVVDLTGYEDGHGYRILRAGAVGTAAIDEMLKRKREDLPRR